MHRLPLSFSFPASIDLMPWRENFPFFTKQKVVHPILDPAQDPVGMHTRHSTCGRGNYAACHQDSTGVGALRTEKSDLFETK